MAPLHLIYPAFVSAIVLSSSHVVAMYSDDGYFDPRMITPKHFMTHEEVLEEEFYDSLREAELMRLRKRRRMQASGDDDGDGDDYTENPDDGGDGESTCTLDGSPTGTNFCCTNCNQEQMKKCSVLGGNLIEDKYGKLRAGVGGDDSCSNLEYRAERLGKQVFGPTKTFRDTPECRRIVYDYTCYWWGSDNSVYTNNCKEKVLLFDGNFAEAVLPPCLDFCTEVANMCANRPDWIKLCAGLQCDDNSPSPDAGGCTPGPSEKGSGIECNKYTLVTFYSKGVRGGGGGPKWGGAMVAGIAAVGLIMAS
ncbi:hypothetical protein TrCOL_g12361 [Triparma columacea]|uniref:Uncharacterized protein n=1 Tax=Triparma columacea TaxID=722753 RepID=A0A9W7GQB1_9STRA|nr:hypothetical protein TrCOL_g12361 [Triparma columacea]